MGIDQEETKNTLFGGLKKSASSGAHHSRSSKAKKSDASEVKKSLTPEVEAMPKWKTFEKVTVLMTTDQRDALEETARKLVRFRSAQAFPPEEKERITANTIARALLDNFMERIDSLAMDSVKNEEDVRAWLKKIFK